MVWEKAEALQAGAIQLAESALPRLDSRSRCGDGGDECGR